MNSSTPTNTLAQIYGALGLERGIRQCVTGEKNDSQFLRRADFVEIFCQVLVCFLS